MAKLEGATPILRVANLRTSLDFYERVLGFKRDWGGDGDYANYAAVSRDGASVMLCEGAQGNPGTWIWFGVDDADRLHEEYRANGATIKMEPTTHPWAREFQVTDPDGHVLRFGSDADE